MTNSATLQQPVRSSVTRIATTEDVKQASLGVIGCLNKIAAKQRELDDKLIAAEARLVSIEAHASRLIELLQAAAAAPTQRTRP